MGWRGSGWRVQGGWGAEVTGCWGIRGLVEVRLVGQGREEMAQGVR